MILSYYTDGACSGNPGPGGWAVIGLQDHEIFEVKSEYIEDTTNNRCELLSLLYVAQKAKNDPDNNYYVFSDSAYAVNSITKWLHGWAANGWKNSKKQTVENVDIMKQFYEILQFPLPNFMVLKIHGHAGVLGNELADAIASKNKQKFLNLVNKNNLKESYI